MMNYKETLDFLYNSLPMFQKQGKSAFKKDLSNIIKLCEHLGNPQHNFKSVHIAGTNGKGSTAHSIAAILQSSNYKTGLYTSPHLKDFTERIKINGLPIQEQHVIEFVAKYKQIIDSIQPSFFEMTVAMAFEHFSNQNVDIAIIEVGLGGRLDSTNVITPLISVITNIGFDHTDMLGETLTEIAGEKAGIIKHGIPVVISEFQDNIAKVFKNKAEEMQSDICFAENELSINKHGDNFIVKNNEGDVLLDGLNFDLKGRYHFKNIPGIIMTIEQLKLAGFDIGNLHVIKGFNNVTSITNFKGRWQVLQENPLVICDIAHNVLGVEQIVDQLKSIRHENLHIVWGMVKDKNIDEILKVLPTNAIYYYCQAKIPRALDVLTLYSQASNYGLKGASFKSVDDAIQSAKQKAASDDLIFIGGSTFVVAEIDDL